MFLGKFDCATGLSNTLFKEADLAVRTATAADRNFIDKLQKENAYAVGFIQNTVWDKYVFGGERNFVVFVCEKIRTWSAMFYLLLAGITNTPKFNKLPSVKTREGLTMVQLF